MLAVDGHPADRVEQHDVVDDGREAASAIGSDPAPSPASVAGPAGPRTTRVHAAPGPARPGSRARSPRASRRRGRCPPARAAPPAAPRGRSPRRAATRARRRRGSARPPGRRTTRPAAGPRRAPPRPRCPAWRRRRTATARDRPCPRAVTVDTRSASGNASASAIGSNTDTRQPVAAPSVASAPDDRRRAGQPERRRGKVRLHVDLQRAPRMAGHDQLDHAVAAAALGGGRLRQAQQARVPVGQRPERLADDDGLGAAAADPALDRAVGMDDPHRPRPGRRGTLDRHDRGDRERPAGGLELGDAREQAPSRHGVRRRPSRAGSPRPSGA